MQTYQTAQPPKYLEEYVDCYWILEKDAPAALEGTHRYLPLGCQELLVNFGNPWRDTEKPGARIPASSVSGQFIRRRTFITQGPIRIFSISFKPYGWSLLTGYPAFEFSNTMTNAMLLNGTIKDLPLRLMAASSAQDRVEIANCELLKLANIRRDLSTNIPTKEIVKFIHLNRGKIDANELARRYYCSLSALERNFNYLVGLTINKWLVLVVALMALAGVGIIIFATTAAMR